MACASFFPILGISTITLQTSCCYPVTTSKTPLYDRTEKGIGKVYQFLHLVMTDVELEATLTFIKYKILSDSECIRYDQGCN